MTALTDADQDAGLREEIACCLARQDGWSDPHALYTENFSVIAAGGAGDPVWWDYRENADALIAGPLAILRSRATAAEAERDSMVAWAKSATHACDKAYIALSVEEDNLISLAKMYGEACGELQTLRHITAGNLLTEAMEDDEQGQELLQAIVAVTEARDADAAQAMALTAENAALRGIIADSAKAIGNGAAIGAICSLEFMSWLPKEIAGVTTKLRDRATAAEDKLKDREAEIERMKLDRRRVDNRIRAQRATLRQFEARHSAIIGSPAFSSLWSFAKKKAADCRVLRAALASTEPHASSEEATDAQ